jgi:bifunctional DNA-binding transcriptional regulator/antitoxin component of YhaV-PrlF toxin-antitoxin module
MFDLMTPDGMDRYDSAMPTLKITSSGQVSIPADIRRRWSVTRLRMIDHGDHVTFEPIPDNPWEAAIGAFKNTSGMTMDELRAIERKEGAEREEQKYGRLRRSTTRRRSDG